MSNAKWLYLDHVSLIALMQLIFCVCYCVSTVCEILHRDLREITDVLLE